MARVLILAAALLSSVAAESGTCTIDNRGACSSGCPEFPTCICDLTHDWKNNSALGCFDSALPSCKRGGCCNCCNTGCADADGNRDEACCKKHPVCCPNKQLKASPPAPNKVMLFEGFIAKYQRVYDSEMEKGQRFQIFSENVDQIYASNAKNRSYTLGITENADKTFEEWRASHLSGFKPVLTAERKDRPIFRAPEGFAEPDSVDWVSKGGVTEIKNQGTCGSCWTFSTVGALEGAMFASGRKMVDLSMQQILACDKGGNGCGGGSMPQAFNWVSQNGISALSDDPYLCKDASSSDCKNMQCGACTKRTGETCVLSGCTKVAGSVCDKTGLFHHCVCPDDQCFSDGKCGAAPPTPALVLAVGDVVSETNVDSTENALEAAVAQQPVSVAIEADKAVFQHYTSGVLTNDACGSALDHGVLAVGYGVDNGVKYWKVKNSWGTTFGEDGYIRIEKGDAASGGECGIRKMASFPVLKEKNTIVV